MLQPITNVRIHRNLLKYWFTLLHFVMDDPVDSAYCIPYCMENLGAAAAAWDINQGTTMVKPSKK